jgi:hypothetical protein
MHSVRLPPLCSSVWSKLNHRSKIVDVFFVFQTVSRANTVKMRVPPLTCRQCCKDRMSASATSRIPVFHSIASHISNWTNVFIFSMLQSPWEACNCLADQVISWFLWNRNIFCLSVCINRAALGSVVVAFFPNVLCFKIRDAVKKEIYVSLRVCISVNLSLFKINNWPTNCRN